MISGSVFADLNEGLVAYYPFNGNANDESGNGHDGTNNGATLITDRFENTNSAYTFDGVNDYIKVIDNGFEKGESFTVSLWVEIRGTNPSNNYTNVILDKEVDSDKHEFRVCLSSVYSEPYDLSCCLNSTSVGASLNSNKWYHLILTTDNDETQSWLNGNLNQTVVTNNLIMNGDQPIYIGSGTYYNSMLDLYFYGSIDDIRIYNRVLTESEIDSLYHEGGWPLYETGMVTDIDDNTYQTVKIGNQTWMAENLKVTHYRNGNAISKVPNNTVWSATSEGAYCNYDNTDSNADIYGSLYNWYAVNDSRNIAPEGWHIPTDEEWKELEMYLGMSQVDVDATGWRGTDEGGKLKHAGTSHWNTPNAGATNESGFTALPGGYRNDTSGDGTFNGLGLSANFWSSTDAWTHALNYLNSQVYRNEDYKSPGHSVRCVKDSEPFDLVAYYPFNGNANDESGNGNDGTVNGATLIPDRFGNSNSAYSFNGVDNYIEIPHSQSLDLSEHISISYWAKLKTQGPYSFPHHIIEKYGSWGSGQRDWDINFIVDPDSNGATESAWCTSIEPDRWVHIVGTYDGFTAEIYHNGLHKDSDINPGRILQTTSNIVIGKYTLGGNYYFDGELDDIRIYSLNLTESEIDSLYHEGGWILPQSDNLVVNPSFENGLDNWNPYQYSSGWSSSTNNPHSGLKCAEFSFPSGSGYYDASMKQTGDHLYVQAGIPYFFSFWRRETDTHDTHTASQTILDVDLILNGVNYSHPMPNMSPSNTWMQIDTTISFLENGYVYIDFQLHGYATSNSAVFAVDDIYLGKVKETITLSIDSLNTFLGDTIDMPVNIELLSGKNYDSAELKFGGYQNGLKFIGVDTSSSMTGSAGWSNAINECGDSLIISWFAGAKDISGSGVFCRLKFAVTGEPCNFIPINIESALLNTGGDPVSITNGGIYIKPIPFYGDVDSNGEVQAHDAALILKHVIEVETLDCQGLANADVTLNDTVTALDASIILQYGVGLIDSLPYDTSNGNLLAKGSITMKDGNYVPGQVVEVPLTLSGGGNILSFEGCLSYKPEQLVYNDIEWSHVTEGFLTEVNESDGRLVFAGAGSAPDGESGVFATVRFVINASFSGVETTVSLDKLRWNEGAVKYDVAISTLSRVTAIDLDVSGIPTEYSLSQNYPNPFNPITTIQYAIPEKSHVILTIYNIAGQALEILENQSKEAGYYSVQWDASKVGSGVYLYEIKADKFRSMKKCVILK